MRQINQAPALTNSSRPLTADGAPVDMLEVEGEDRYTEEREPVGLFGLDDARCDDQTCLSGLRRLAREEAAGMADDCDTA